MSIDCSGGSNGANYGGSYGNSAGSYAGGSYNSGANYGSGDSGSQQFQDYTPQMPPPFNLQSVQLPAPQMGCYQPSGTMPGQVQFRKGQETQEVKNCEMNLTDNRQAVRDNIVHHQHVKNVIYNVNRNHTHCVKLCTRDNNYHHHLINNIVRVNDIHNERIEEVKGQGRTTRDYKQTSRVEAGGCRMGQSTGGSSSSGGGYSSGGNYAQGGYSSGSAGYSAGSAGYSSGGWQQSQQYQSGGNSWQPQQQQQYGGC